MSSGFLEWFLGQSAIDKALQDYAKKLENICNLMKSSHIAVINLLEKILVAKDVEQAKNSGMYLRSKVIADIFRNLDLCDSFEKSGNTLREIVEKEKKGRQNEEWKMAIKAASLFSRVLEDREDAVAKLYGQETQEIENLSYSDSSSLEDLQQAARKAESKLISELADFDSLANQFQQQLKASR